MLQIAWFLLVMVSWQDYPMMLGPYSVEECFWMREFLERRGYVEAQCEVMPYPQPDAVKLEIPYLPREQS